MPAAGHLLFALNVDTRGLTVHALVNGITVYINQGTQASFAGKINPLIFSGTNTVTLSLGLAPAVPDPPKLRMTVQRGVQGIEPGEAGELLRFDSTGPEGFRGSFEAREVFWRPRWVSLPPVEARKGELEQFVLDFVARLEARDVEGLLALHQLKFREGEDSLGFEKGRMAALFGAFLRRLMEDPQWTILPVDPRLLVFSLEAEGRMVRISQPSGEPPVMTRNASDLIPFAITVSRVDGQLQIIR